MNVWRRFKDLPMPFLMLHVTAKFLGGVGLGVLLGGVLKGYGWWIIAAGFVVAIPSSIKILTAEELFAARQQNQFKANYNCKPTPSKNILITHV